VTVVCTPEGQSGLVFAELPISTLPLLRRNGKNSASRGKRGPSEAGLTLAQAAAASAGQCARRESATLVVARVVQRAGFYGKKGV